MIYDWSFCACSDQDGNLLIGQQNEKGNLEIRSYNAAMQESIVELAVIFFRTHIFQMLLASVKQCISIFI